jgi:hypothetical protein
MPCSYCGNIGGRTCTHCRVDPLLDAGLATQTEFERCQQPITTTLAGTTTEPLDDGGCCGCNTRHRRQVWSALVLWEIVLTVASFFSGDPEESWKVIAGVPLLLAILLLCPNNRCSGRAASPEGYGPGCGCSGDFRKDPNALGDILSIFPFCACSGGSSGSSYATMDDGSVANRACNPAVTQQPVASIENV